MIRSFISFTVPSSCNIKQQVLHWSNSHDVCTLLDNQQYNSSYHTNEFLAGVGVAASVNLSKKNKLLSLQSFIDNHKDWIFGHLNYDLKDEMEDLHSNLIDSIGFPELFFYVPQYVLMLENNTLHIGSCEHNHEQILLEIISTTIEESNIETTLNINHKISKEEYVSIINKLQQHILKGDCYEINFCQEFYANNCSINPLKVYQRLCEVSPNPFSAYYKLHQLFLCCASPERYLKKTGQHIISQPIKGTNHRNLYNTHQDEQLKQSLLHSKKDRIENVMVVDLVRNDLSKVCQEGTVQTEELYGIYTFPQVHQMISTIGGELSEEVKFSDIIKATFPMGSMTGAPKRKVMQLIEQYEKTKRGLFSGAVGYIKPNGDFDFNVVIRSIFYNAANRYLSFLTGSGITFNSQAEKEYEECLLKANAILQVLKSN